MFKIEVTVTRINVKTPSTSAAGTEEAHRLWAKGAESSFAEKAAESLVDNVLRVSEQCPLQLLRPVTHRAASAARATRRAREAMTPPLIQCW